VNGRNATLAVAGLAVIALVLVLGVLALRSEHPPVAAPSATPTATAIATATASASATATAPVTSTATAGASIAQACRQFSYQAGDVPIVPPRLSGQHLQVALDAVRPGPDGGNRWFVRFFVPGGAPGPAVVGTRATVTGPAGPLQTGSYEYGPPNAGTAPVTQPLVIQPCQESAPPGVQRGVVVVGVQTSAVRSGTYTLTWSEIGLPEGGSRTETWTVTLTCELDPGPARPQSTVCK
jgi:hypothetical protein